MDTQLFQETPPQLSCQKCIQGDTLGFEFSMAFQPIVNTTTKSVFSYEALARGPEGQGAFYVFEKVSDDNLYLFDQHARVKAIELAAKLNVTCLLNINFMPRAVYKPERCIRTTLEAAEKFNFPVNQIVFEFTESEELNDTQHLIDIVDYYSAKGFLTAIDDFGAGYSNLNRLYQLRTQLVKIDMELVRDIDTTERKQIIVKHTVQMAQELDYAVIAEGIETKSEYLCLKSLGVELMQGYYFAKPGFESLPHVDPTLY